MENPGR